MALTKEVIMPSEDYVAICNRLRSRLGSTDLIKSGDIAGLIGQIEGGSGSAGLNIAYGDTPPDDTSKLWVKAEQPDSVLISPKIVATEDTLTITTLSNVMPWGMGDVVPVVIDGKIYFGGTGAQTIHMFDPETETMTSHLGAIPENLTQQASAAVGKKLYHFGGITYSGSKTRNIYSYDTETGGAELMNGKLYAADSGLSAIAVDNKVYLFGGESYPKIIQVYDVETDTVTKLSTTLTYNHIFGGLVKYGSDIVLYAETIQAYNLETGTSRVLRSTNSHIFFPAVASIGNIVYAFGGQYYSGSDPTVYSSVYAFDMDTYNYSTAGFVLPFDLTKAGAVAIGSTIYVFGGYHRSSGIWKQDVIKYEFKGALAQYKMQIEIENGDQWNALSGIDSLPVGVKNVYIGNADGVAELVEAYLYDHTLGAWITSAPVLTDVDTFPADMNQWTKNEAAEGAYTSITYDAETNNNVCQYTGAGNFEAIAFVQTLEAGKKYVFSIDYYCPSAITGAYAEPYAPFIGFFPASAVNVTSEGYTSRYAASLITVNVMSDYVTYKCSFTPTENIGVAIGLNTGSATDGVATEFHVRNAKLMVAEYKQV